MFTIIIEKLSLSISKMKLLYIHENKNYNERHLIFVH